jgi:L-rhamnose mutarotase
MEHILFKQKIKKGKVGEYVKAHREMWPDLLKKMNDSGIENMMIWVDNSEIYLYTIAEDFDKAFADLAKTDVFIRWLEKMAPLLDVIQDYSKKGKIEKLEQIFNLKKQLQAEISKGMKK